MIFVFFLLFLLHPVFLEAALSPEARRYLEGIPGKKLTLPLVVEGSLKKSMAFKLVGYDYLTAGVEEQSQFESLTDTVFVAGNQYTDDNSAKTNPFRPLRVRNWQWNFGFEKFWKTGTRTTLSWQQDQINTDLSSRLGSFGNTFLRDFRQSSVILQLEQNLLKDAFGFSFRQRRLGARRRAESIELRLRDDLENLVLVVIGDFYKAWLLKQQVVSLNGQIKRQKRLVRILTRRNRKGAVEKPDLIRVRGLLSATGTRLEMVKADLVTQWEKLVIGLKLPDNFLNEDPMDIPMDIDNPVPLGLKACDLREPTKTARIQSLEKSLAAFDSDFKASKNESLPDLKLIAEYRGNSIDNDSFSNFRNLLRGSTGIGFGGGPFWKAGVQFSWPLDNSRAKAQRTQGYVEREKASARLRIAMDDLRTRWRDQCRKLQVENRNKKIYGDMVREQKKRVKADEKRFSLGRIGVDQLIAAEDDLGQWEFNNHQKAVEVRRLAWQVQKFSGEMYKGLIPFIASLMEL